MFNKIVEFLFCADIIKTPKVFCLTFGVHITVTNPDFVPNCYLGFVQTVE